MIWIILIVAVAALLVILVYVVEIMGFVKVRREGGIRISTRRGPITDDEKKAFGINPKTD